MNSDASKALIQGASALKFLGRVGKVTSELMLSRPSVV
jgi:hypothetical protein